MALAIDPVAMGLNDTHLVFVAKCQRLQVLDGAQNRLMHPHLHTLHHVVRLARPTRFGNGYAKYNIALFNISEQKFELHNMM